MALTDKLTAIADAIRVQSGKTAKITLSEMPTEIINLQSLNFNVVGNPKPENPRENTIWLNTDVAIPNWIFTDTKPSSGNEGAVCILTGTGSACAFNALKKNAVMVNPIGAVQYNSGAWKNVEIQVYQGGWKNLLSEVVFFGNGKINTDVFGNTAKTYSGANEHSIANGNIEFRHYVEEKTSKLFDVSAFNTIECTIANWDHMDINISLADVSGNVTSLPRIQVGNLSGGFTIFDISGYTGEYYLVLSTGSGGTDNSNDVSYSSIVFKA